MPSKSELFDGLKKDLKAFYQEKKIAKRINELTDLFGEEDEEEIPYEVISLLDSLEDIKKIIG